GTLSPSTTWGAGRVSGSRPRSVSEREADAELHAPRRVHGEDLHERRAVDARVRVTPPRVVQHVGRLRPELHAVTADVDVAEGREVEVPDRRPAEGVAARVAPLEPRRVGEGAGIVI